MKANPIFVIALLMLAVLGAGGVWLITGDQHSASTSKTDSQTQHQSATLTAQSSSNKPRNEHQTVSNPSADTRPHFGQTQQDLDSQQTNLISEIKELLAQEQFKRVIGLVSDNYSALSQHQLDQIRSLFLSRVERLPQSQNNARLSAFESASDVFKDEIIWQEISNTAIQLKNWDTALGAQLNVFQLQSDPQDIATSLRALLVISNALRAKYDNQGDELSIKDMYQRILRVAFNAPRFQLELAYSHLRLEEEQEARSLLEQLVFDPEVGNIAQEALARLNESSTVAKTESQKPTRIRTNGIVVPLESFGTSFIVNTRIERQNTRLLLDTGASITALSRDLINRLNLTPINRQIRLNTANGSTTANLYQVDRLQLGRLVLNNIIVADIDMGNSTNFQGLLGTDTLNKLKNDYSYVIDNAQKALIFKRR